MRTFLCALTFFSCFCLSQDPNVDFPVGLIGTWKVDCQDEEDLYVLGITKARFSFWEAVGEVKFIQVLGSNEISVTLDLYGDGKNWQATTNYKFSKNKLIQTWSDGKELVRNRCQESP